MTRTYCTRDRHLGLLNSHRLALSFSTYQMGLTVVLLPHPDRSFRACRQPCISTVSNSPAAQRRHHTLFFDLLKVRKHPSELSEAHVRTQCLVNGICYRLFSMMHQRFAVHIRLENNMRLGCRQLVVRNMFIYDLIAQHST